METSTGDEEKHEQRISSEKLRYDPGSKRIEGNKVGRRSAFQTPKSRKRGIVQWTVCSKGVIGRSDGAQILFVYVVGGGLITSRVDHTLTNASIVRSSNCGASPTKRSTSSRTRTRISSGLVSIFFARSSSSLVIP